MKADTKRHRPLEILLVEDNAADAMLARRAFASLELLTRVHHVEDGVEAMEFLRRQGKYALVPKPDLLLLDLNLPRKSGREVLAEVRADPKLSTLLVVVLSTSRADDDVQTAYKLHSNAYIAKPLDIDEFFAAIRSLEEFFFSVAIPPSDLAN